MGTTKENLYFDLGFKGLIPKRYQNNSDSLHFGFKHPYTCRYQITFIMGDQPPLSQKVHVHEGVRGKKP